MSNPIAETALKVSPDIHSLLRLFVKTKFLVGTPCIKDSCNQALGNINTGGIAIPEAVMIAHIIIKV